jgi:hypothetical protein
MPIIDSEGLFGGDRFDLMTDEARLYWPYFWCASNTMGRMELNYLKFVAKAFARFRKTIPEKKFWELIEQYQQAYLLFVYKIGGQVWGQWDTSEKFLPRHKLASDERSPAPTVRDFTDWKNQYIELKEAKSNGTTVFGNPSEGFRTNVRGVGVGVGGGGGKTSVAKDATGVVSISESDPATEWFNREFWPAYPRHTAKKDGLAAARKLTEQERAAAIFGLKSQLPELRARDPSKIPHPATWLNGRRWEDEPAPLFVTQSDPVRKAANLDPYAKYDPKSPLYEPHAEN